MSQLRVTLRERESGSYLELFPLKHVSNLHIYAELHLQIMSLFFIYLELSGLLAQLMHKHENHTFDV